MASNQSSVSLDDLIENLAERTAYNTDLRRKKQADIGETLRGLGSRAAAGLKASPAIGTGLIGAGLGAGYGLASSFGKPEEERRPFSSMLSGALSGGALGAGAGLAGGSIMSYLKNRQPSAAPEAGTFQHNGREYRLKGDASGLLPELQSLEERSPVTRGVGTVTDAVKGYASNHPLLATLMGADVASHVVGTGAEMLPTGRGGAATRGHFLRGLASLKEDGSQFTKSKIEAMKNLADVDPAKFHAEYQDVIRKNREIPIVDPKAKAPAAGGKPKPVGRVTAQDLRDVGHRGTGAVRAGGIRSLLDIYGFARNKQTANPLTGTGYGDEGKAISGWLQKLRLGKQTADRVGGGAQTLLQRAGSLPRPTSLAGRLGWRGGLYAGLPAAQWYLGQSSAESAARQRIEQLLQQHATPTGN